MENFLPIIRTASLFSGISDEEITMLLTCLDGKISRYGKGSFLLHAAERTQTVGLLLAGSALIVQEDFWGNRNLISPVAPGQLFAEAYACCPGAVLNVSVTAAQPCTVLWLNVHHILTTCPTACSHHTLMIRNLLSDLAEKNLRVAQKLTHMGQRSTQEKLLSYLSSEAQKNGCSEFDIPFNRQQLADYLSVDRSAMSATLCRLRDSGVLSFDRSHFVLHLT